MTAALVGLLMAFTDPAGGTWCGRVSQVDIGPGGVPYAWLEVGNAPTWVTHLPVRELRECKA